MKQIIKRIIGLGLLLCLSVSLIACSPSGNSSIEVQEGVEFKILDALKINNKTSNTVYYYFLASVENKSDKVYHMSNLNYRMASHDGNQNNSINAIDRMQTVITNDVNPEQSTFVYGFIGFANSDQKNPGLYFPDQDVFLPFNSVKVRTINDENITNSDQAKFTIYEDNYFEFDVDASDLKFEWNHGKSLVSGLNITYRNKTKERLVVPFLSPVCTIDGLKLQDQKNADQLKKMNLDELKKQDFKVNGHAPKTTSFTGTALGYQLYYLSPEQEVVCPITFEFENVIPDFESKTGAITININSPALGYSQTMKVKS
ncbi:hypothetical protein [Ileibacterium valens]|uniref:hypothetical protein n=1 Tax=Ileibacterium valens TaxID=1862668 RepID=UPI0023538317|nr:hypothetical protein [Ileibacterium valens]